MSTTIAPDGPRNRVGCVAKGCLAIVCLLVFLAIAFVGGGYWALRQLQKTYSASEPISFGNVTSERSSISPPEAPPAAAEDAMPDGAPTLIPEAPQSVAQIQARWRAFEKAANRGEKARVELTASDINTLIENDPKLRGKAAVTIENNVARVQVSVPLGDIFLMSGRYLNGEATVQPAPDGKPENARISNIILANQTVPETVLDQRLFGWSSIRGYMSDWLQDRDVAYFNIQNNRVIGETRGGR